MAVHRRSEQEILADLMAKVLRGPGWVDMVGGTLGIDKSLDLSPEEEFTVRQVRERAGSRR